MDSFIEEFLSYLNLIYRLSISENSKKTQSMIQCIVNHVQYKFVRNNEIVTLKMELQQVDNLIEIFRARFGENLVFEKTIREGFSELYLPSNTVLALVESALVCGLVPKEGDWKLSIEMMENDQELQILMLDNGIGFSPSKPDSVGLAAARTGSIAAVNSKLKDYFDCSEPVDMSSSEKSYNRVVITIPKG